jgi:predicted AlkP superfamily pyrophosphatase or phosphodiesterase
MTFEFRKAFAALLAILLTALLWTGTAVAAERTIVVVMFDGFAPAMADATQTPNLDRIKREGAWSRHLVPAFPTLSATNHTTFETGCWPEHHGIMSNVFYDPKKGRFDGSGDADWRTGCETMWEAAERQGVRTAALNFVGRWSGTKGKRATYANPLVPRDQRLSDEVILAQGLKLLRDNGPGHPRLIALYFQGPDETAHFHGTTAPETLAQVRKCDAMVGTLMAAIKALPANREGTLIVGTDHGMMDVGPLVNIGRLMNMYDIKGRQASDGASTYLYLDKGESTDRVAAALSPYKYAFDVYRTGQYPSYAHLGTGPRLGDMLLVSKPPYWMVGPEVFPSYATWLGVTRIWPVTFTPPFGNLKATHGYDPHIVQMHGIFYAWGAGIAKGQQVPRLDMIDIHPTVMALLGLQPGVPVDGHVAGAALSRPY